jgi:hypothetical protein
VEAPRLCHFRRRQQAHLKPTQPLLKHTHQSLLTLASRGVRLGLLMTSSIPARCF